MCSKIPVEDMVLIGHEIIITWHPVKTSCMKLSVEPFLYEGFVLVSIEITILASNFHFVRIGKPYIFCTFGVLLTPSAACILLQLFITQKSWENVSAL